MPASGSHRSIAALATRGLRLLPGAVRMSTSRSISAERSSRTISAGSAVPWPKVRIRIGTRCDASVAEVGELVLGPVVDPFEAGQLALGMGEPLLGRPVGLPGGLRLALRGADLGPEPLDLGLGPLHLGRRALAFGGRLLASGLGCLQPLGRLRDVAFGALASAGAQTGGVTG